jgi:putative glycerol-1-phosphate prenyltransferase
MKLPYLPTAYLLIDGGALSTTQKVTNTLPLDPKNKAEVINTALAAEQLGFKAIYLEAGSGAKKTITSPLIKSVKKEVVLPLIVGGGLDSVIKVKQVINSGANMVVIGNALEKNVFLLTKISKCF